MAVMRKLKQVTSSHPFTFNDSFNTAITSQSRPSNPFSPAEAIDSQADLHACLAGQSWEECMMRWAKWLMKHGTGNPGL